MRIAENVLAVLSGATTEGEALRITAQLDRKLYVAVNEALEAAGGKWNRKAKAHLFQGGAAEALEPLLLTGEYVRGQDFGCFFSPPAVVARLMELAEVQPGMRALEPSAGQGAIVEALLAAGAQVDCVELLEANVKVLKERFGNRARVAGVVGQGIDFRVVMPTPMFDRVVMNPPFAGQADLDHVTHAFGFLKPGGRLVAVMAAGVMFRENRKTLAFRDLVTSHGGSFERLPDEAFREAGTSVRTVIVTIPRGGV